MTAWLAGEVEPLAADAYSGVRESRSVEAFAEA